MNCKSIKLLIPLVILFYQYSNGQKKTAIPETGSLTIHFVNTIKGLPLVLRDSTYSNPFGESYNIKKLKYYISNAEVQKNGSVKKEKNSYHLVNAEDTASWHFMFTLQPDSYNAIGFLVGVDSLRNCSGAQSGALDPLNDMFWTWNSGYVMLKMEGSSNVSHQSNNRFEYHIGGFTGSDNVVKKKVLPVSFLIDAHKNTDLYIEADISKFWLGPNEIRIAENPVCTTPGKLSKRIADNYMKMFSIKIQDAGR